MAEQKFQVGQRVQINPSQTESYLGPWKARVAKGLFGTVTKHDGRRRYDVQLDVPKRVTHTYAWFWRRVFEEDLLPVDGGDHG